MSKYKLSIPSQNLCQVVWGGQGVDTVNTIREQLVNPKDPTPMEKKCEVIYKIQCRDCEEIYIGETARPFGVRFIEHVSSTRLSMTAVGDHLWNTRHTLDLSSSSILVREKENDTFKRRIRVAIEIHLPGHFIMWYFINY